MDWSTEGTLSGFKSFANTTHVYQSTLLLLKLEGSLVGPTLSRILRRPQCIFIVSSFAGGGLPSANLVHASLAFLLHWDCYRRTLDLLGLLLMSSYSVLWRVWASCRSFSLFMEKQSSSPGALAEREEKALQAEAKSCRIEQHPS